MTQSFRPAIDRILIELGETNMRCAIMQGGALHDVRVYKLADHTSMGESIRFYCDDVGFKPESRMGLIIALAPQPKDGVYYFKNYVGWDFRPENLLKELGLASIHLLNDLESHAYAILGKDDVQSTMIHAGQAKKSEGPVCVIAPGTGLGYAYVFDDDDKKYVQGTFGAHIHFYGFGVDDDVYPVLVKEMDAANLTIEDVVSGPGLARLRALVGTEKADAYFMRTLGFFIHNVVMYTHALGGVIITGGLIPALMAENKMDWDSVYSAFMIDTVPGVTGNLERVPWSLVDDPLLGLKGLLAWAEIHIDT